MELLSEKVKNMSLTMKEDKFKLDDKLVKLGSQGDLVNQVKAELDRKLSGLSQSTASLEEASRSSARDLTSIKSDLATCRASLEKCVKNVEDNSGNIFGCVQDCEMIKDNLGKLLTITFEQTLVSSHHTNCHLI